MGTFDRRVRKHKKEKNMKKIITLMLCLMFVGCSTASKKEKDSYKILWGKRCTEAGTQFSYVWIHTVYGPEQVKKEWCK